MIASRLLLRALPVLALFGLAACAPPGPPKPPAPLPGYEAVQDGDITVPQVPPHLLTHNDPRGQVPYAGEEAPGTIVVDTHARRLYLVEEGGTAMRYSIAVGRTGLGFRGSATVGRKEQWPAWTPTANMVRTYPEMYAEYAGGLPGGLSNPLGARALYLYRGGKDTYYRIHGTSDIGSIGRATSAGCIRLFNQDIMDLYERVPYGTRVKVRTKEESLRLEGEIMEDLDGRAMRYDPVLAAQIEAQRAALAAAEAEAAAAAASGAQPATDPAPAS